MVERTFIRKGKRTTVNVDFNKGEIATASGGISKVTRTKDKSGKTVLAGRSKASIYSEFKQKEAAQQIKTQKQQVQAIQDDITTYGDDRPVSTNPKQRDWRVLENVVTKARSRSFITQNYSNEIAKGLYKPVYEQEARQQAYQDKLTGAFGEQGAKAIVSVGIAESKLIKSGTGGIISPRAADVKLEATSKVKNQKVAYTIEQFANKPLTSATVLAAPFLPAAGFVGGVSLGVRGTALGSVSKEIITVGGATQEQAKFLRNDKVQQAYSAAIARQGASKSGFGGFVYDVSVFGGGKDEFKDILGEELKGRGFTGKDLSIASSALLRQRVGTGTGEIVSFLGIGAGGERMGRFGVKAVSGFAERKGVKTGGKFFKSATVTSYGIAPAGGVEGGLSVVSQSGLRQQTITVKDVGLGIGAGTLSASSLGGLIGGTAISKKATKLGKFSEYGVANIVDPYEYAGDRVEAALRKGAKIGKKKGAKVPSLTFGSVSSSKSNPFSITSTLTSTKTSIPTSTPVSTKTSIPTFSFSPITTFTPTSTATPVSTFVGVPTPTTTSTPVSTTTSTPVSTPIFRIPLIGFPISFGAGGGGSYTRKGKGKKRSFGLPPTLTGLSLGIGTKTKKGKTYSGLGVRL